MLKLILSEQIPSGKNAMGVRRDGRHYPNPRFETWRSIASFEIMKQKVKMKIEQHVALPLLGDLTVTISYRTFDNTLRDVPGMLDALWNLLTHTQIIQNDGQIKGVTWIYPWRMEGPCVEMRMEQF